ncbi:hypothetical protein Tco_1311452 [Tanacetum coccineum]
MKMEEGEILEDDADASKVDGGVKDSSAEVIELAGLQINDYRGDDTMTVVQMVETLCALQTQFLGYNSSCGVANPNELIHLRLLILLVAALGAFESQVAPQPYHSLRCAGFLGGVTMVSELNS